LSNPRRPDRRGIRLAHGILSVKQVRSQLATLLHGDHRQKPDGKPAVD
jgi:hypothetical protein